MNNIFLNKILNRWNSFTSGSVNRQIFKAAMTIATGTVFVKLLAVSKEIFTVWQFGLGDQIDIFLIALLIPSFVINVVAGSLSASLIPTYIQVREKEGKLASQKLLEGITLCAITLLIITTIIMLIIAHQYLPFIAHGFDKVKQGVTLNYLYAVSPIVLINGIICIWSSVLNAGERFALAAVTPSFTPIVTILLLFLFKDWGTYALVAGLILGTGLEALILGIALKRQKISLLPKWYGFNPPVNQVLRQFIPKIAGSLLMCSTVVIDQSMAAMLSSGSVAALSYASRVTAFPITLANTALSTAVVPYFSKMIARDDIKGATRSLTYYLRLIFIISIPFSGCLIIFSHSIIEQLFQKGNFTANNTDLVASIQSLYTLQIPFYLGCILLVRFISSTKRNHILFYGSSINLLANVILNYVFMKYIGLPGIALSTSIVYMISFSFLSMYCFLNKNNQTN
ncbi:MAG: lipid II flippase MurJ [Cyanobacteria bacterium P01_A01_bin.45]